MGRLDARPSMVDVGRLAHVSAQTVSRYFTGSGYVSAAARARIATAVAQLGYVPNHAARNLRAARTDTIGVLAIGALNHGSTGVLTGIVRAAREHDVSVAIAELDLDDRVEAGWEADAARALDQFLSMRADGVILSSPVPGARRLLVGWSASTPALSVADLQSSGPGSSESHSYTAGLLATRHLVELGHRDILHVAGPLSRNEARDRQRGYTDAVEAAGARPQVIESPLDWSAATGHRAGLACDPTRFSGVFAANDEIALGFMSAMEERGLRAPADFSIVGVDDMPAAAYFSPALTTVALDFAALGRASFAELRTRILTGEHGTVATPEPELVVRASSAPPAHRPVLDHGPRQR